MYFCNLEEWKKGKLKKLSFDKSLHVKFSQQRLVNNVNVHYYFFHFTTQ